MYLFQGIARLQRQQQIVDEVKLALKPFFKGGEVSKDEYKLIMKKSVDKVRLFCFFLALRTKLYILSLC